LSKDVMDFDVDAWLSDPAVWLLRSSSRDIWHTMFCYMHKFGRKGELSGVENDLAALCRVSRTELVSAIKDIEQRNVGDVSTDGNGVVTIICRRMKREYEKRLTTRLKVTKHRLRKRGILSESSTVTTDVTHDTPIGVTSAPPPEVLASTIGV
jgi:hypothetical protein